MNDLKSNTEPAAPAADDSLIDVGEVMRLIGVVSRVTIWRRLRDPKSDFPNPIDIGNGRLRWFASEMIAYVRSRPRISYLPPADVA